MTAKARKAFPSLITCILLLVGLHANAATYEVAADGSADYSTIQECADTAVAGDTCHVQAGTYEERVTVEHSGTTDQPIVFQADPGVVMRGFELSESEFVRIVGFEITHVDTAYPFAGILLHSAHGSQILDNVIHHTYTFAIILHHASPSNNVLIGGNSISYAGVVPTNEVGDGGILVCGNDNLIEGNDISHVGDFTNGWGDFNVFRNNNFHDVQDSDFPAHGTGTDGHHVDGFQYFSADLLLRRTLFEGNRMSNLSDMPHAHGVILRNIANDGSGDFIYRRNAVSHLGSSILLVTEYDGVRTYNNTFYMDCEAEPAWNCIGFTNAATGAAILNNIFVVPAYPAGGPDGLRVYQTDDSSLSGFRADYSLAYQDGYSGSWSAFISDEPNGVFNEDPVLLDDLTLDPGSPAIDRGGPLTLVSAGDAGTGTALIVDDAGFFQDGWAGVLPDWIAVGTAGNVAEIASIDYDANEITLSGSVTRSSGDPVWLARDSSGRTVLIGDAPDIGAYEYGDASDLPPTAFSQMLSTPIDTPLDITLTASDPDGDPLTFSVAADPAQGSLSGDAPGLTYTPDAGFVGSDSFTFRANDGTSDSNVAVISIVVGDQAPEPEQRTGCGCQIPDHGAPSGGWLAALLLACMWRRRGR